MRSDESRKGHGMQWLLPCLAVRIAVNWAAQMRLDSSRTPIGFVAVGTSFKEHTI